MKVNFHPETRAGASGLAIAIIAADAPNSTTAISFENGMTEEMMLERIKQSFRTLAAGIAEDNRSAA